ncbi:MAG: tetratricopeptide repeat protein [Gemmataceae bacterium]|nr:tetratricopeptide repeat protein [Gemmataceae bacterium]MCI0739639.1 tetratricopeptide repeat protein [Gemmataceae bacterium]
MRAGGLRILGCCIGFWWTISVHAGLYNTGEVFPLSDDFLGKFRATYLQVRSIGAPKVEVDNPVRRRYLLAEFASKADANLLTEEQKINLSEVLIRRRRTQEAIHLLQPLSRGKNLLAQSNLATAYFHAQQLDRAQVTIKEALKVWPEHFGGMDEAIVKFYQSIGWTEHELNYYKKAEKYFEQLVRLRLRESLQKKAMFESVDALFDDGKNPPSPVRFIAESGKFEAGRIAKAEKAKLPRDALEIVQQLLIWLPEDLRLYWLLGEIYNAMADNPDPDNRRKYLLAAKQIFDELAPPPPASGSLRAKEFLKHLRTLRDFEVPRENEIDIGQIEKKIDDNPKNIGPDLRTLGITLGVGIVAGFFLLWQLQEIKRRRTRS